MAFKRIKDWLVSITSFRTGDVIPVDGPDGTAKMSKDDLLVNTANYSYSNIKNITDSATEEDMVPGSYVVLDTPAGGKKLPVNLMASFSQLVDSTYMIIEVEDDGLFVIDEELNIGASFTNEGFFCSNVLNFIAED